MRLIVYNPRGGAAIRGPLLRAALRELVGQGVPHEVVATDTLDMAAPVRRALGAQPGVTQIVACGGDGTVAACTAAASAVGRDIPVAIIPTGTTNVLAYELGIPASPVRAARMLAGPLRPVRFRTWDVNGHPMILQLGIGFDGRLIWRTPRAVKRALGFLGVTFSALRHGVSYDYPRVRVTGDLESGERLDVETGSVLAANAQRWAGPQLLVPGADPTDDLLDVLLIDYRNFAQLARFWLTILFPGARHLALPWVRRVALRRLTVEGCGGAVEAHVDGEPLVQTPIRVQPLGRATLLAPGEGT